MKQLFISPCFTWKWLLEKKASHSLFDLCCLLHGNFFIFLNNFHNKSRSTQTARYQWTKSISASVWLTQRYVPRDQLCYRVPKWANLPPRIRPAETWRRRQTRQRLALFCLLPGLFAAVSSPCWQQPTRVKHLFSVSSTPAGASWPFCTISLLPNKPAAFCCSVPYSCVGHVVRVNYMDVWSCESKSWTLKAAMHY